jgi:hypothetical protein
MDSSRVISFNRNAKNQFRSNLRHSFKLHCAECNYIYWTPLIGNCPKCHCDSTLQVQVEEHVFDYIRT